MIRVPHIAGGLHPQTERWAFEHHAQLVQHEENDGHGYYDLLCAWWTELGLGDLVIVEQDKIPAPGVTDEMLACEFEWCSCPFPLNDGSGLEFGWGLGCVKFAQSLRERLPDAMIQAGVPGPFDSEPANTRWMVDVRLGCVLARNGVLPHAHAPGLHLHEDVRRVSV